MVISKMSNVRDGLIYHFIQLQGTGAGTFGKLLPGIWYSTVHGTRVVLVPVNSIMMNKQLIN